METLEGQAVARVAPARSDDQLDTVLRGMRFVGLVCFLGGLAALSALWAFSHTPQTLEQWHTTIAHIKAIFFSCAFTGIVILVVSGSLSWWRHRRRLHRARWFRLMMAMLVVAIPGSHLWARLTAEKLYEAVEDGRLNQASALWDQLGAAYIVSTAVMFVIAMIAIVRPSLGKGES